MEFMNPMRVLPNSSTFSTAQLRAQQPPIQVVATPPTPPNSPRSFENCAHTGGCGLFMGKKAKEVAKPGKAAAAFSQFFSKRRRWTTTGRMITMVMTKLAPAP